MIRDLTGFLTYAYLYYRAVQTTMRNRGGEPMGEQLFRALWGKRESTSGLAGDYDPQGRPILQVRHTLGTVQRFFGDPKVFHATHFHNELSRFAKKHKKWFREGASFPLADDDFLLPGIAEAARHRELITPEGALIFHGVLVHGSEGNVSWFGIGDSTFTAAYLASLSTDSGDDEGIDNDGGEAADKAAFDLARAPGRASAIQQGIWRGTPDLVLPSPSQPSPIPPIPGDRKLTDRLIFALDGITVQHVGEMFFSQSTTVAERRMSSAVYLASLRDFALAVVYGQAGTITTALPNPEGKQSPGQMLCEFFEIAGALRPGSLRLDDFIAKPDMFGVLKQQFQALATAVSLNEPSWRAVMLTEASTYMGSHPSVFLGSEEEDIVLGRHPPYVRNTDLELAMSPVVVEESVERVLEAFPGKRYRPEAVRRLVTGFTLAHVGISHWYEPTEIGVWRLPFVTRSTVHWKDVSLAKSIIHGLHLWMGDDLLMSFDSRHASRLDFLLWLRRQAWSDRYDEVRKFVRELDFEWCGQRRVAELERIRAKIERAVVALGVQVLQMPHGAPLVLQRRRDDFENLYNALPELRPL